ncbi:MAG: hypothetical protein AAF802_03110 [Planctomycetota bacterium]
MRTIVYGLAILIAVGIMYSITMSPGDSASTDGETSEIASAAPVNVQTTSVTLNVPKMHCAHGCYPTVKESLENEAGIVSVELAPQKEEGVLDNRQVIMTCKDGYEPNEALAVLENVGFGGASVAE